MRGLLNIDTAYFPSDNYMEFPDLVPVRDMVHDVKWFSFPKRSSVSVYGSSGLHFYCQDFTFDALWNQPTKYIDVLKQFRYVIQPDFSLYYNFPKALQIFNKYRNHWLARYLGFYGVNIIPNVNVSTPDCWDWSFLGYPKRSVVSFSDIGSFQNNADRAVLCSAFDEMLIRLEPIQILYFSRNPNNVPDGCVPIIIDYDVK